MPYVQMNLVVDTKSFCYCYQIVRKTFSIHKKTLFSKINNTIWKRVEPQPDQIVYKHFQNIWKCFQNVRKTLSSRKWTRFSNVCYLFRAREFAVSLHHSINWCVYNKWKRAAHVFTPVWKGLELQDGTFFIRLEFVFWHNITLRNTIKLCSSNKNPGKFYK